MKNFVAAIAIATALPLSGTALAQDMPSWPTSAACSPGDAWCDLYERRTRVEVAGVWETIPPDVRSACISETEAVEKSYRLLSDCLANKMQELMRGQTQRS